MMKDEVRKFIRFLKEHDVYNSYKSYAFSWVDKVNICNSLNEIDPGTYISSSFCWCETVEGHNFWQGIHKKWLNCCRRKHDT